MAKEILVNDGGAPARIIPMVCNEAISAGEALKMHTDGYVMLATALQEIIGFALTDAVALGTVNVVSGSGVVLNVITDVVVVGNELSVDEAKNGFLKPKTAYSGGTQSDEIVAIALETNATTATLTKVMVV